MIEIKISIPGFGNDLNLSQYLGNRDNIFGDSKFYVNNQEIEEVDFWFVFDDLQQAYEQVKVSPSNIYYLNSEIIYKLGYFDSTDKQIFLNQFSKIFSSYDIFKDNSFFELPFLGWMINANHGDSIFEHSNRDINWFKKLDFVEKTKNISVFCSNKIMTEDHALRYKFTKKLKNYFGEYIDWFGNGINSLPQKWDGIAPYKYHVVLENQSRYNVITEKIYDSFLGLSFPFYWGASNLSNYFPQDSFQRIEIQDWKSSIDTIEKCISNDKYSSSKTLLIDAKNKVLNDFNPFQRISKIVEINKSFNEEKKIVGLFSMDQTRKMNVKYSTRILNKFGRTLIRFGNILNRG